MLFPFCLCGLCLHAQKRVEWDSKSLIMDGKRVMPVMGEIQFSRLPVSDWRESIKRMKDGGVTIISTYVFWNHIEDTEGVFNWQGCRNLRLFLEQCAAEDMPVILRIGPFVHGESRCGGIPDWVFGKGCKIRSEDSLFLDYVKKYYRQIYTQVQGLQWKDGGPVLACQFDNEYRGKASYLLALKKIATEIGFDLPFYTRTGWPKLKTPVPFGEIIPFYGDYADGFWEHSLKPTAGGYYKAFNFKQFRSSTAIATDLFGKQSERIMDGDEQYPYFTCELGGGMAAAYHRRPYMYPIDAYSLAVVKLGSGCNLLGYYLYHSGTNPDAAHYLNENQRTLATNNNDLPVKAYDYQSPLGEFGQANPHYFLLRKLHLFMKDWEETLAPMDAAFPAPQNLEKGEDKALRWSYRSAGDSGFVFINNYERLQKLSDKRGCRFSIGSVTFPTRPITIPASTICIFPVNISGIRYATAQLVAQRGGKIYMEQIPGIPTEIAVDGKVLKNVKPRGVHTPVWRNIYLLDSREAEHLFLPGQDTASVVLPAPSLRKLRDAAGNRTITIATSGNNRVAEAPTDEDFDKAAVYAIENLPAANLRKGQLLEVDYRGDVARLYADGKLIGDNFYNGRPFLYGLWRLPHDCKSLELRVIPLQKDMPVYFPEEADTTPGEEIKSVSIRPRS